MTDRRCISRWTASRLCVWALLVLIPASASADHLRAQFKGAIQLEGLPNDAKPVVTAVAIHPQGPLIATAGDDHVVRLWHLHTGQLIRELHGHQDWVTTVSFCSDGSKLISGSRDRTVWIWDVNSGRRIDQLGKHRHAISRIAVSQTNDVVAVAGFRAPLKVFELDSGRLMRVLSCPCSDMRAINFSPDLRFLAAGSRSGIVRVWDLKTGTSRDIAAHPQRVWALVFTDDNRLISGGQDNSIRIWNPATGHLSHQMQSRSGKVLSMIMIGRDRLAVASADNILRLFHLEGTRPHAELQGHTGSIAALDYRNQTLISGSFDTTVRVWSIVNSSASVDRSLPRHTPSIASH